MHPCTLSVRAVLFDLDGVLVDSTGAVEEHWRAFAARHELDPERLLEDLHGRRMVDIITRALPDLTAEQHAHESRWLEGLEADGARGDCVVVEDAPAGLAAGHGAGCTTVGVTTSHAFDELDLADHVVATPAGIHPRPGTMIELELDCIRQDSATHAS